MVAGKIVACKWVRLACERHLNDLERSKKADFPYRFDAIKASRVPKFGQNLPHVKGKWAAHSELIKLEPSQLFEICSIFGWVEKANPARYRFREAYIEKPRKNAKSTEASVIGVYKFSADGEFGAEVYSGATTEKQAWEVFRPALQMVQRTPMLQRAFGITVNAKSLTIVGNGSRFEPVIGKPGDGASPSCAIVDEYHEHPDDTLYDTMKTGMGARENPLMLVITTAGSDRSGPCYAMHLDAQKVLEGKLKNERWFCIIYTIDEGDDWQSEAALVKANPLYGVSIDPDYLREQQRAAIQSARKQNAFKTKHLNIWCNADVSWMNSAAWDKCADPSLNIEDFEGEECCTGLDLASRLDLASKLRLFRRKLEGKTHFYGFAEHYLNAKQVDAPGNEHYAGWANEGWLIKTPGDVTDFNWIAEGLIEDSKRFYVRELPHDPPNAGPLLQFCQARDDWNQSIECVEVAPTTANYSPAMREVEAAVEEGRFHHNGDPVLAWAMSNVVCHTNARDQIYPRKQRAENKIDPATATFLAIISWMKIGDDSGYTSPEVMVL